jgi:hypothetical protein
MQGQEAHSGRQAQLANGNSNGNQPAASSQQPAAKGQQPKASSHQPAARSPHLLLLIAFAFTFQACLITDHSERDGAVSSENLNFPKSGYEDIDPDDLPSLNFEATHMDLGQVVQGTKVERQYTFTNTGGGALVITDVRGSCGCTVGKVWPKEPVPPGAKGTISVSFDSEGRSGRQDKTVTVVANTSPPSTVLTLSAEVVAPQP